MRGKLKHILILLFGLSILVVVHPAMSQKPPEFPDQKLYSVYLGGYVEFRISNDTIYRTWVRTTKNLEITEEFWIIRRKATYRRRLYVLYQLAKEAPSDHYMYFALKMNSDSCIGIAFTDVMGYACGSPGCAEKRAFKRSIKKSDFDDRELFYLDFCSSSILDECAKLRNLQNADSIQANQIIDSLISSMQFYRSSQSTKAIEKNDLYFYTYHRAQSLMAAGFNPLVTDRDDYNAFIKKSRQSGIFESKFKQYLSIKSK